MPQLKPSLPRWLLIVVTPIAVMTAAFSAGVRAARAEISEARRHWHSDWI